MITERPRGRLIDLGRRALPALMLALSGCSADTQVSPDENWRDLQIHVEARSYAPIPAMKELLVFVNRDRGLPAWDCRVDVRTSDADPWKQAIEDGRVGVYRRATRVDAAEHSVVQVWIHAEGNATVLRFPLNVQTSSLAGERDRMVSATLAK
jgi:hypothetical protein